MGLSGSRLFHERQGPVGVPTVYDENLSVKDCEAGLGFVCDLLSARRARFQRWPECFGAIDR